MNSDENFYLLEKQLKTLGQKIRLDILTKLENYNDPISYSVLQKEVLGKDTNLTNFSFHLKTLKKHNLIDSSDHGYSLSSLGKQVLKKILSIGQILNEQNETIFIRTSKYSTEPFNTEKIEHYLINEGKLERSLSRKIATEVEERLSKTKISYLTTPLMREYINGILLEKGLEETRHRLTRLGTPPFEVEKYFTNATLDPELFIHHLGSESSEQFLLLNLLPKNLGDLYLSGDLLLTFLNYWSLRPLSIYIDSNSIIEVINSNNADQKHLLSEFFDIVNHFKPFFSADIVLGHFSSRLPIEFENLDNFIQHFQHIYPFIFQVNKRITGPQSFLSLDFSSTPKKNAYSTPILIKELISIFENYNRRFQYFTLENSNSPLIIFDYSMNHDFIETEIGKPHGNPLDFHSNLIFYNGKKCGPLNSMITSFFNSSKLNGILLDKILINLHKISLESKREDNVYFDKLNERLDQVFQIFQCKKQLITKKFHNLKNWNTLSSIIFKEPLSILLENSIKSVSFVGLNNAVEYHCGIELDRIESSENFARKILKFMLDILNEKNGEENEFYSLSQPHCNDISTKIIRNDEHDASFLTNYTPNIVRVSSNLPLNEKIQLHKRFEDLLSGGTLFEIARENFQHSNMELFTTLINANLNAFRIS